MERSSSRIFTPLAVAASLISAGNAKAIEGDANGPLVPLHAQSQSAPSPDPAAFCEELKDAPDSDSDIQEFVEFFSVSYSNHISMQIVKEIHAVLEDGGEVILECSYPAEKSGLDYMGKTPTKDFAEKLLAPTGRATILTVQTPTAMYKDRGVDGMPDEDVYFTAPGAKAIYDATGNYYWQGTRCIDNSYGEQNISDPPCEGYDRVEDSGIAERGNCDNRPLSDTAVCKTLGVGLDDFDAAIQAGRKALNVE